MFPAPLSPPRNQRAEQIQGMLNSLERDASPAAKHAIQFHADKLSSAHIYLRLPEGQGWEEIPADLLADCAQLTKANSIEGAALPTLSHLLYLSNIHAGNKKDNVTIIYTPWSNLRKDGSMATGQVSFKDPRKVKRVMVETRINAIVNRLNKTKEEKYPDLYAEKEDRLKIVRARDKRVALEWQKEEQRVSRERKEKAWQRDHAYDEVFTEDALEMSSNEGRGADFYDDFM